MKNAQSHTPDRLRAAICRDLLRSAAIAVKRHSRAHKELAFNCVSTPYFLILQSINPDQPIDVIWKRNLKKSRTIRIDAMRNPVRSANTTDTLFAASRRRRCR